LLERIVDAHEEAKLLLLVGDREPVFQQDGSRSHQHALEFGDGMEEFLVLVFRAESHHPLDAGAVVPAAIEQHDLSAGRQVRHVALEVPLGAFALARSGQSSDTAYPRIEALRDSLDDPALPRRVAPLEDDHDLALIVLNPILQLHQLALQAKQLLEVDVTLEGLLLAMLGHFAEELGQPIVVDLELELLVDGLEHLAIDAMEP
jgi:hypothetical protein